eukprot:1830524-Karenia_brevis.AAC.1
MEFDSAKVAQHQALVELDEALKAGKTSFQSYNMMAAHVVGLEVRVIDAQQAGAAAVVELEARRAQDDSEESPELHSGLPSKSARMQCESIDLQMCIIV